MEGNAAMEIAELPGSLKTSVMIHCFRVFNVNWPIGKEGHSELRVFYLLQVSTPEKQSYLYIFLLHTRVTSARVIKVPFKINNRVGQYVVDSTHSL